MNSEKESLNDEHDGGNVGPINNDRGWNALSSKDKQVLVRAGFIGGFAASSILSACRSDNSPERAVLDQPDPTSTPALVEKTTRENILDTRATEPLTPVFREETPTKEAPPTPEFVSDTSAFDQSAFEFLGLWDENTQKMAEDLTAGEIEASNIVNSLFAYDIDGNRVEDSPLWIRNDEDEWQVNPEHEGAYVIHPERITAKVYKPLEVNEELEALVDSFANQPRIAIVIEGDPLLEREDDPIFPYGTNLIWSNGDETFHPESRTDALINVLFLRGEISREIVPVMITNDEGEKSQEQDEQGRLVYKTVFSRINEVGDKEIMSETKQWLSPEKDETKVVLNDDGSSDFSTEVIPAITGDVKNGHTYWNETGELLPEYPEEVEGLKLYSEENGEEASTLHLISLDDESVVKKEYTLGKSENGESDWIPRTEFIAQEQIKVFEERLKERGVTIQVRIDDEGNKYVQQGYLEGEDGEMAYSDVGKIVEMSEEDEEINLGLNIGRISGVERGFELDRFTNDGDNIVTKTSDGRNYFKYYPNRPLESLRWRQVGEEMAFGLESEDVVLAFGQSIANQGIYNASWSETPYNYTDPETGEVKQLVGVERVEEAWALALKGFTNYLGENISLDDIRDGNATINYTTHNGEEKFIDSSKPFHFTYSLIAPEGERYRDSSISADAVWFYVDGEGGVSMVYTFVTRDLYNTFNRPSDSYEGLLDTGMSVGFKMIQRGIITTTDFRGFLRNDYDLYHLTDGALAINGGN